MVIALAAGIAALTVGTASPATSLTIVVWPDGPPSPRHVFTLRCDPAGGTLPRAKNACAALGALGEKAFAPVPKDAVCTQVYGGPAEALVTGTYRGRRIWTRFRRRDGCEIARWNRHVALFPVGGDR